MNLSPQPSVASSSAGGPVVPYYSAGGRKQQRSQPAPGVASKADELKYATKYRQLRGKVKEIEDENQRIHARILKAKRQIQRLRLEKVILTDRYHAARNSGQLDQPVPSTSTEPLYQDPTSMGTLLHRPNGTSSTSAGPDGTVQIPATCAPSGPSLAQSPQPPASHTGDTVMQGS